MEKAATTKKGRAPTAQKKKPSAASHPPYFQMIKEAILALHERTGSSPYAIAKFMEEKHKGELPENFRKLLAVQLRNCTVRGKLAKVKASFKLSSSAKQEEKKVVKDVKPKVTAGKNKTKEAVKPKKQKISTASAPTKRNAAVTPKKHVASGKGVKKSTAVKAAKRAAPAKPKPKSIKASTTKKAKKASA
ncbi:hypothetical protein IEQ34_014214 [Dendrobium chrysotoxum]|uniref:H15 domain-containing protein n=1 Tax=Dendrobium chrysotoxum TaxID=161865 RepID=A0AAV7GK31_DENCH|nr:hypothetical protein IEQ34_014214 [Dendrobium chrysotoxum]